MMSRTSSSQRQILSWISDTWSDASPHIDCFATWISDSTISLRVPRNKRLVTRRTGETGSGASAGQLQMYPREKIGTIPDTLGKSASGLERIRRKSCNFATFTVAHRFRSSPSRLYMVLCHICHHLESTSSPYLRLLLSQISQVRLRTRIRTLPSLRPFCDFAVFRFHRFCGLDSLLRLQALLRFGLFVSPSSCASSLGPTLAPLLPPRPSTASPSSSASSSSSDTSSAASSASSISSSSSSTSDSSLVSPDFDLRTRFRGALGVFGLRLTGELPGSTRRCCQSKSPGVLSAHARSRSSILAAKSLCPGSLFLGQIRFPRRLMFSAKSS